MPELHFPTAGVDLSRGFADQQPRQIEQNLWARTCREGVNVRGSDTFEERRRGGSRPGLQKVFPQSVVVDWIIQAINVVVTVTDEAVVRAGEG